LEISPDWAIEAAEIFFGVVRPDKTKIISSYFPMGKEIDPSPIVEKLWSEGIKVCLPKIQNGERGLAFAEWNRDSKLVSSTFGTSEPDETAVALEPDILIVPLLAFDQTGNRMGYGQGHYDETLRKLRAKKDVLAVGLAYAEQAVLLALPTEPHDQKLDIVVTPQRIFDFRP
jgi:5-formyltetrahydrofolate cyclo-ligase